VAYQFVKPAPPKKITIATGSQQGVYYALGQRYREILARDEVTLEIRSTAGSVENVALLEASDGGIDAAFVQGGIGGGSDSSDLASLGSLYYEPLWVFHREELELRYLSDLRRRRIAVGAEGSGTQAIALQLLTANGVDGETAVLRTLGGQAAADALRAGDIDAAFFVVSPQSAIVRSLMTSEGVALMNFERAEAYTRLHHFLSSIELPRGVIDLETDIPAGDKFLLAPTANLVVRDDFHPALIDLLLQAAAEVHGGGGLFEAPNEFPSPRHLDFPLHKEARRYFRSGPPFLQRFLPFWAASLVDRLKVMLLPLLTLLIPLMKVVPPTYRWKVRSKVFRWYKELQAVDHGLDECEAGEALRALVAELDRIEHDVTQVSVPYSYAAELYDLRLHIAHVREKLRQTRGAPNQR
jgi:TRAP transporter TAXI family solute receptor